MIGSEDVLVSVVTPCFRMKRYLKTFLEELSHQTIFQGVEVVLDHNEPDAEELDWVAAFAARHPGRIRHIVTAPAVPIGVSMNACIRQARGRLLAIWNVDDLRTPGSLEAQVRALNAAPQAGVAFGDYMVVWSFGSREGRLVRDRLRPQAEQHRGMLLGPFFMFRVELCERAGLFDEQLRSGADFDFALRLLSHAPAVAASGLLGFYLNAGLGASTRSGSLQSLEKNLIYLRYGIWDKLEIDYLPQLRHYEAHRIVNDGNSFPVAKFFRDYEAVMAQRTAEWFPRLRAMRPLKRARPLLRHIARPLREAARQRGMRQLMARISRRWC
jgi:glycosyltransferase involved in cell wall biosynthesis